MATNETLMQYFYWDYPADGLLWGELALLVGGTIVAGADGWGEFRLQRRFRVGVGRAINARIFSAIKAWSLAYQPRGAR